MCFVDDDNFAECLRSLIVHGKGRHKYDNTRIGINGRLDTLQAAILLSKFEIFDEEVALRQQAAERYSILLKRAKSIKIPFVPLGYQSVWAQYSLLAKNETHRSTVQAKLRKTNIPTATKDFCGLTVA